MSYAHRRIQLTFTLGKGSFGNSGADTIKLAAGKGLGLQALVHIELANTPSTGMAQIRVWGMTLDHMNQLSKAGLVYSARNNNKIKVEAGDDEGGMTTVFNGLIIEAYPDFRNQPEVFFYVFATPTPVMQLKPVSPTSFPGAVQATTVMQSLAEKAGLTLEANGVQKILQSPYFDGAAWGQILSVIKAADVFGFVDGIKNVLAVWDKNGSRSGGQSTISKENGMIGYPSFQAVNIIVRTEFFPNMLTDVGQTITVKSELEAANGKFNVFSKTHDLSAELPDGPWETTLQATPPSQKQ